MKPARFHPEAEDEFIASIEFYDSKVPGLGHEFGLDVEASVELVRQDPAVWSRRTKNTRSYIMRRFPFSIVYLDLADHIWVVAVAHASRKPGYWEHRT